MRINKLITTKKLYLSTSPPIIRGSKTSCNTTCKSIGSMLSWNSSYLGGIINRYFICVDNNVANPPGEIQITKVEVLEDMRFVEYVLWSSKSTRTPPLSNSYDNLADYLSLHEYGYKLEEITEKEAKFWLAVLGGTWRGSGCTT